MHMCVLTLHKHICGICTYYIHFHHTLDRRRRNRLIVQKPSKDSAWISPLSRSFAFFTLYRHWAPMRIYVVPTNVFFCCLFHSINILAYTYNFEDQTKQIAASRMDRELFACVSAFAVTIHSRSGTCTIYQTLFS